MVTDFPTFGRGLSLRTHALSETGVYYEILSLSGETFNKAQHGRTNGMHHRRLFPYMFVGIFIEAPLDGCIFRD